MEGASHLVNAWVHAGDEADGAGKQQLRQSRVVMVCNYRHPLEAQTVQGAHTKKLTSEVFPCIFGANWAPATG